MIVVFNSAPYRLVPTVANLYYDLIYIQRNIVYFIDTRRDRSKHRIDERRLLARYPTLKRAICHFRQITDEIIPACNDIGLFSDANRPPGIHLIFGEVNIIFSMIDTFSLVCYNDSIFHRREGEGERGGRDR